jgi:hypothetical protein
VGANRCCRQLNPCFVEDDMFSVEDEPINPFTKCRARERSLVPNNASRWKAGFKLDIP